jgi:LAO/AO transport system kinase
MSARAPLGTLELPELVERAATDLDRHCVARLVSVFQDRRPAAAEQRIEALARLDAAGQDAGTVIGITGTPGSGKSSLIDRLARELLDRDPGRSLAILAVDPSSHLSGGALLGDRTRMQHARPGDRLFFRSEASATELGGLGPTSFQVCRLLIRLFDCVIVETVGIGQSEADIRHLADQTYLVIAPLGGDEVQFLKAGIIEIPDVFVVNKCDEPSAAASYGQLRASLGLARPFESEEVPVLRTSARTGAGVPELADTVERGLVRPGAADLRSREPHFLERWVRDEWGRVGADHLRREFGGAGGLLAEAGEFDAAQRRFGETFTRAIGNRAVSG